jgi:hypothetical protein
LQTALCDSRVIRSIISYQIWQRGPAAKPLLFLSRILVATNTGRLILY